MRLHRSLFLLLALVISFGFSSAVWAQSADTAELSPTIRALFEQDPMTLTSQEKESIRKAVAALSDEQKKEQFAKLQATFFQVPEVDTAGTVNCFDYYHFGSVQVDVSPTLSATVPGATMGFVGQIKNANEYPIVSGEVYAKIFFKKSQDDTLNHQDGYSLIDQFVVKEGLSLAARGEEALSFSWMVPSAAETGEYQIAFYFVSAKRYNLLGLSFTDDVTGNTADFSVVGSDDTAVSFDKNAVALNDATYNFAAFPPHFAQDESVVVETKIVNPKDEDIAISVSWKLYAWDGLREEALRDIHEEVVFMKAKETKKLTYVAEPTDVAVSYLVVEAKDHDMKSFLDIRFVRDGIEETRINFPSIATYPLQKGEEATIFSCAHSTNQPIVKDNVLTLTLRDEADRVIHTYRYEGDVTGEMMGVKDVFVPQKTYANFSLTATLEHDGQVVESVTQKYACQEIDPTLCPKVALGNIPKIVIGERTSLALALTLIFFLGVLFWKLWKDKKDSLTRILSFLFIVIISGTLFFGGAREVEAKSVSWSGAMCVSRFPWVCGGGSNDNHLNFSMQVNYSANVYNADSGAFIPDGSTIPVGTRLNFVFTSPSNYDATWFGNGYSADSPYGYWNVSSSITDHICTYGSSIGVMTQFGHYWANALVGLLNINSPGIVYNHSGSTAGLSCNGNQSICTVMSAGVIHTSIDISGTNANFLTTDGPDGFLGCYDVGSPFYDPSWPTEFSTDVMSIPAKSIPFTFTAVSSNNPPMTPTITGPITGNAGASYSFSIISSDPDNDTLHYGIDWDNNGSVDQWAPTFGYTASNTAQSVSYSWAAGIRTFQVLAQDSKGANSGWASYTITLAPAPTLTFIAAPTTLPYTGGTATLSWTTTGTACWASNGWNGWQTTNGSLPKTLTTTTIFSLECWNAAGVSTGLQSVQVTVTAPPLPTVELLINGSQGPLSLMRGDARNFTWITTDATTCTASSSDGWSGNKSMNGSESSPANITSNHSLTCTGPGGSSSDSVLVNVSCIPETGAYGACDCPTETKTRSNLLANCAYMPQTDPCDTDEKNACRDFNWKEVAP